MDAAHELFGQFKSGKESFLEQVIQEEWPETLLLDFKTTAKGEGPMTKDDKRILAEALSGFANADGGVIVWGVDCRKYDSHDPDTAKDPAPIKHLKLFHSDLLNNTPQMVSPGIIGVEHFPVEKSGASDTGYIITYVPKGQDEPHMAIGQGQHRFYFRSGSSFLPMEQYMIADRFRRRPQPTLEISYRFVNASTHQEGDNTFTVETVIGIRNVGLGIALYPTIGIHHHPLLRFDPFGLNGNGDSGLPKRVQSPYFTESLVHTFAGGINHAIHPGTTLDVTLVKLVGRLQDLMAPFIESFAIIVKYELYCEGFAKKDEINISGRELERVLCSYIRR